MKSSIVLLVVTLIGVFHFTQGVEEVEQPRVRRHMFPARVVPDTPTAAPKCKFGTIPAKSESGDCYQMKCVDSADCHLIFGANSTCDWYSKNCVCDSNHQLDEVSQTCSIPVDHFPACVWESSCAVPNSACINSKCQCQFGYVQNGNLCSQLFCDKDEVCRSRIGPNTRCNYGQCECDYSYSRDRHSKQCLTSKRAINELCSFDSECGYNAACSGESYLKSCKCQVGSVPDTENSPVNCRKLSCNFNSECSLKFNNTKCSWNQCDCNDSYKLNSNSEKCIPKYKKIGYYCTSDMDCGSGASCVSNSCQCNFGYSKKANQMDCSSVPCTWDSQCEALDQNSKCGVFATCSCKDDYYIDYTSQSCVSWIGGSAITSVVYSVGMVSLVSVILTILFIVVRRLKYANARPGARIINAQSTEKPPAYTAKVTAQVTIPEKC